MKTFLAVIVILFLLLLGFLIYFQFRKPPLAPDLPFYVEEPYEPVEYEPVEEDNFLNAPDSKM